MIKIFFYNSTDKLSKSCLPGIRDLDIKCINVSSRKIANRIKLLGVTKIPTLYCKNENDIRMLIGSQILEFLENIQEPESAAEQEQEVPADTASEVGSTEVLTPSKSPPEEDSEEQIDLSRLIKSKK